MDPQGLQSCWCYFRLFDFSMDKWLRGLMFKCQCSYQRVASSNSQLFQVNWCKTFVVVFLC